MKSIYTVAAEQKAREASNAELSAALKKYAADVEGEGRTYAPAFMREAALRLELATSGEGQKGSP